MRFAVCRAIIDTINPITLIIMRAQVLLLHCSADTAVPGAPVDIDVQLHQHRDHGVG